MPEHGIVGIPTVYIPQMYALKVSDGLNLDDLLTFGEEFYVENNMPSKASFKVGNFGQLWWREKVRCTRLVTGEWHVLLVKKNELRGE